MKAAFVRGGVTTADFRRVTGFDEAVSAARELGLPVMLKIVDKSGSRGITKVDNISDTAFENCELLTIVCMDNSPAMFYAQRNDIPYETFVIAPVSDQYYTGKPITPVLDVKQAGKQLMVDKDYSAVYSNNINVGVAMVAVAGLGDYSIFGTTVKFNIVEVNNNIPSTPTNPPDNNHSIDDPSNPSSNNKPAAPNDTKPKSSNSSKSNGINTTDGTAGTNHSKASVSNNNSTANSTNNKTSNSETVEDSNIKDSTNTETENTFDTDTNQESRDNKEATNDKNENEKDNFFIRILKTIANLFKSIFNIIKSWFE